MEVQWEPSQLETPDTAVDTAWMRIGIVDQGIAGYWFRGTV
jgi:hypothetical protein